MAPEQQRVALVTGAARGIGLHVVRQFLAETYHVVAFDREPVPLAGSERLLAVTGDGTRPKDVSRLLAAVTRIGRLHVLVNTIGGVCTGTLEQLSLESWEACFHQNLTSVFLLTRALLPALRAADGDRVIVNLSSTLARVCDPELLAYGAFKAAVEQFTRTLALDLARSNIRVVCVAPGPVANTPGEQRWPEADFRAFTPLRRFASAEEVASVIGFVASPSAGSITGCVYAVDGGDSALGVGWSELGRVRQ